MGLHRTSAALNIFAGTVKSQEVSLWLIRKSVVLHTPQMYDTDVADLQAENIQDVRGIKVKSIFNALQSFHISQPGLLPCLGHDLFEGVLSHDLTLYLKDIIKKWFTYSLLNRRIKQFKYKGSETLTKSCAFNPDGAKLSGQAIQNWNLLRLPYFILMILHFVTNQNW